MTVSSLEPVNNYTGNNSVKIFDFDFLIENEQELKVSILNLDTNMVTELVLGVDYSINEVGNKNGSYITFPLQSSSFDILKENQIISLSLSLPIKQESEFENSADLKLDVLEWTFDYIVRILQILNRKVERAIKVDEGEKFSSGDDLISFIFNCANKVENKAEFVSTKAEETFKNSQNTLTALKTVESKANNDLDNLTQKGIDLIKEYVGKGQPIGTVFSLNSTISYCPEGCLSCDGTEYSKAQFEHLWENYLTSNLLNTCSYEEYEQDLATYGQCSKFAVKPLEYDGSGLTVVGNPTITDDGIASGLVQGSNTIKVGTVDVNALKWKVTGRITPLETPKNTFFIMNEANSVKGFSIYKNGKNVVDEDYIVVNILQLVDGVENKWKLTNGNRVCWLDGNTYDFYIERDGGTFKFGSKNVNEQNYIEVSVSGKGNYPLANGDVILLQTYADNKSEFDLKQFKIEVDGQTVLACGVGETFKVPTITCENKNLNNFVVVANGIIEDSQIDWNEWSSGLQSKANKDFSNCTKPYVVETSDTSIYPSWYRIWSDGWCEQGGITKGGANSTGKQVSLLKNLNDNYSLRVYVLGPSDSFNAAGTWVKTRAITNSSFYIATGYTGAGSTEYTVYDCSWEAKGYLQ